MVNNALRLAALWMVIVQVLAVLMAIPAAAATEPPEPRSGPQETVQLALVASGLQRPVYMTAAPGDRARLFIVEKAGRIRIVHNGALLSTPFLDITNIVKSSGNEQGLLSMAFHPNYASNGYFYVNYTGYSGPSGDSYVARYQVTSDPNVADPQSGAILMTVVQPYSNHNGGQLQFGPDGYLYIGFGDGGSGGDPQNNGQRTDTLLGKVLRIDVNSGAPYAIPPDNPFLGDPNALDEIWSLGWRNPWRFGFDRLTGAMWAGDVGQNNWEEIDLEAANGSGGVNYGWRCREGMHNYNFSGACPTLTLTDPIYEYSHGDGCSITGGYVYRGSPNSSHFGAYLFNDYCVGNNLRTLRSSGSAWVRTDYTLQPPAGRTLSNPTSFGEDAIGDLYVADDWDGEVFKLQLRPASCVAGNTDVNGDGVQDVLDIQLVANDWHRPDYVPDFDVDCSSRVDVLDVQLVAAAWEGSVTN